MLNIHKATLITYHINPYIWKETKIPLSYILIQKFYASCTNMILYMGHSVPVQQLFVRPILEFDETWYVGRTLVLSFQVEYYSLMLCGFWFVVNQRYNFA